MGGPPAAPPGYGATQQGYGAPGGGYPPPGYQAPPPPNAPSSAVNPLGGTVVADASAFSNPAYGAPQGQPPAPGGYDPNAGGYGAPPQAPPYNPGGAPGGAGGYDPNAYQQQGYGAPAGGYTPPPQQQYGGGFGATEPAGQSYGNMAPYQPMPPIDGGHSASMEIPGTVGAPNPIVTVLLIVCTCGIYGIYLLVKGKKAQQ
jgi:hypothetical protein